MSELSPPLQAQVEALASVLRRRGWMLTTAESCTGGLIAAACTSVAGSSDWFERGFVSYSNAAKGDMLGVPAALIAAHGAVSAEVAGAMAEGALAHSTAQIALAVTGVAGPGGGSVAKPVGTVWMAVSVKEKGKCCATQVELLKLDGERAAVRSQTLACALTRLLKAASSP